MAEPSAIDPTAVALKRRRARNIALGLALGALVVLFYVLTIAKLGPQVLNRPI